MHEEPPADEREAPSEIVPADKPVRMAWWEHLLWIIACLATAFVVGYTEIQWHFHSPSGGGAGFGIILFQGIIAQAAALIGLIASFLVPGPRALGILFAVHSAGAIILCALPLLEGEYSELPYFVIPALLTGAFAFLFFQTSEPQRKSAG